MQWIELLREMGPFTTPLCIAMGLAMRWLLKQLALIQSQRDAALEDVRKLLEQRTTDQVAATQAMGEASRVVTDALREHDDRIDRLLHSLQAAS